MSQSATLQGQPYALPEDLYIPPEALEVILDMFTGPLDLLLYLIKHQNIDILDIPIIDITRQYIRYIEMMQEIRLELAAEYLVMAAMLAEIKSRLLLPKPAAVDEEVEDPRAELARRLQEYERFKQAAETLDSLPRDSRDTFAVQAAVPDLAIEQPLPDVNMQDLLTAWQRVLARADVNIQHAIQREPLSIRQRMTEILTTLRQREFAPFERLFAAKEGRLGVVVTFIALLELSKQAMIEMVQTEPYSPIHVRACESV